MANLRRGHLQTGGGGGGLVPFLQRNIITTSSTVAMFVVVRNFLTLLCPLVDVFFNDNAKVKDVGVWTVKVLFYFFKL